jgi:hypothetical protein
VSHPIHVMPAFDEFQIGDRRNAFVEQKPHTPV